MLLNSFEYDFQEAVRENKKRGQKAMAFFAKHAQKIRMGWMALMGAAAAWLYACPMLAQDNAASNVIVQKIADLIEDFYGDFVFLSLGVLAAVVVYHLIRIMLASGDDRERSMHTRAIVTAIIAFFVINVFMFIVQKLLEITGGRNTLNNNQLFNKNGTSGTYGGTQ